MRGGSVEVEAALSSIPFDSASIRIIIVKRVSNPVMQVLYNLTYACKFLSWVAGLCYLDSSTSRQRYDTDVACFSAYLIPHSGSLPPV